VTSMGFMNRFLLSVEVQLLVDFKNVNDIDDLYGYYYR
jgi:hypothetical protein